MSILMRSLAAAGLLFMVAGVCLAEKVTLKDGRILEGKIGQLTSMAEQPNQPASEGAPKVNIILFVDDNLARRFVPKPRVLPEIQADSGEPVQMFFIKQPLLRNTAKMVNSVGPALRIDPFDKFGRRTFTIQTASQPLDVVQGITQITPLWTKVEGIKGIQGQSNPFSIKWDMRIATSSIPHQTLAAILTNSASFDRKNLEHRLKLVRLYLQSERYGDAEAELKQIFADFPVARERHAGELQGLVQLKARQMLRELDFRQKAGQYQTTYLFLSQFPADGVAGQILQEVREKLDKYTADQRRQNDLMRRLWLHSWEAGQGHSTAGSGLVAAAMLSAGSLAATGGPAGIAGLLPLLTANEQGKPDTLLFSRLHPILAEIATEVNVDTVARLAAYSQLVDDPKLLPQEKLALAVSGWLVGADDATPNLPVALSMADTRALLFRYLREESAIKRDVIVEQLRAQEASSPRLIAKLLMQMKPPLESPDPSPSEPGYYRLRVPAADQGPDVEYLVQLPPEYNPHRRYPTVVTLHGAGSTPELQIDWWAGGRTERGVRNGQASRQGYIVIAPAWAKPSQFEYGYTAREHAAVLDTLRDAQRRFAIDTDRVFISGHSMGGDAAWDIGLAHPDLWAGVVPVAAVSQKYCNFYYENAQYVPFYVVAGELDGTKSVQNAMDLDRMFKKVFDLTVVEYQGRGHENFSDEILNVFDWMARQRRNFYPKDFTCKSMRPWDNFFWWVELGKFPDKVIVDPGDWPPRNPRPLEVSAKVTPNNGISITTGAGQVTLWLSPDMIDFDRRLTLTVNGGRRQFTPEPNLALMLEDARTRADRQHLFWMKVEAGR